MKSADDIKEALASLDYPGVWQPAQSVKFLQLEGYVTSSGSVYNYTLRMFHDVSAHNMEHEKNVTPYRRLQRQSLLCLQNDTIAISPEEMLKYSVTADDIATAKEALIAAWQASEAASEQEDNTQVRKGADDLTFHVNGAYFTDDKKPEVVLLLGRVLIMKTLVAEASEKEKYGNSGLYSKNAAVRAKELLRKSLPLSNYIPRLNLSVGKITSIKAI